MSDSQVQTLLTAPQLQTILQDLVAQIQKREKELGETFILVGIHTRGIPLAQRLAKLLDRQDQPIGILDINLYRDDLSTVSDMPIVRETRLPFDVHQRSILLVDDVLFTGRTIRSALDALMDLGRPKRIELLVLIDRGGRELPIQADYCGKVLAATPQQNIKVRLTEVDDKDEVIVT